MIEIVSIAKLMYRPLFILDLRTTQNLLAGITSSATGATNQRLDTDMVR